MIEIRRREFLLASTACAALRAQGQPALLGRRGVHLSSGDVDPKALLAAGVQFVTLAFRFKPTQALLSEIMALGITVETKRADCVAASRFLRYFRGGIAEVGPRESDCFRAVANGLNIEAPVWALTEVVPIYRKLAALEPWTQNARPIVDIGVISWPAENDCGDALLQLHEQFDYIEETADFAAYRMLVVLNGVPAALQAYEKRGGAILISTRGREKYTLLQLKAGAFPGLAAEPLPIKAEGSRLAASKGSDVLAASATSGAPLIIRRNNTIQTAIPLNQLPRPVVAELLRMLVPKPAVIAPGLPASAEVTFMEQRLQGGIRRVAHVLAYDAAGKAQVLENVQLSVRLPQHPLAVVTVPDQKPVEFVHNEFLTTFTLPRVDGHQAIAFE